MHAISLTLMHWHTETFIKTSCLGWLVVSRRIHIYITYPNTNLVRALWLISKTFLRINRVAQKLLSFWALIMHSEYICSDSSWVLGFLKLVFQCLLEVWVYWFIENTLKLIISHFIYFLFDLSWLFSESILNGLLFKGLSVRQESTSIGWKLRIANSSFSNAKSLIDCLTWVTLTTAFDHL